MYSINCENWLIKKKCQKMTILNDSFYFCTVKKIIIRKNYELFIFLKKLFCYITFVFHIILLNTYRTEMSHLYDFEIVYLIAELPLFVIFKVTVTYFIWWIEIGKSYIFYSLMAGVPKKRYCSTVPVRSYQISQFLKVTLLFSDFRLFLFDGNIYSTLFRKSLWNYCTYGHTVDWNNQRHLFSFFFPFFVKIEKLW